MVIARMAKRRLQDPGKSRSGVARRDDAARPASMVCQEVTPNPAAGPQDPHAAAARVAIPKSPRGLALGADEYMKQTDHAELVERVKVCWGLPRG